jgi:hypothetical protein
MRRRWTILVLPALLLAASLAAQSTPGARYLAASDTAREVGTRYKEAYIGLDWGTIDGLLSENASFLDPTAELVFGGQLAEGREAMMTKFRTGYAGLEMSFAQDRAIFTGHFAIFEGKLTWSAPTQGGGRLVTRDAPFVLVLRIEGGKVVEHRDYADYHPYIEAVRAIQ